MPWSEPSCSRTTAISVLIKLAGAAIVVLVGFFLTNWLIKLMQKSKLFGKIDKSVASFLVSVSNIGLKMVVVITAASILGVPLTAIITVFGTVGVAIGLALQGSLSNLAGSIMILLFRPFKVGDFIEVAGVSGTVDEINFFYTVLNTPDNKRVTIPNATASNAVVTDYSSYTTRRIDLVFGVAYGTDVMKVKNLLSGIANSHELVIKDPEPAVMLSQHADSSLNFTLRVWVNSKDYWPVNNALMEQVTLAFEKEAIEIPFPQVDVHMR